jgi:hypothetical protein
MATFVQYGWIAQVREQYRLNENNAIDRMSLMVLIFVFEAFFSPKTNVAI